MNEEDFIFNEFEKLNLTNDPQLDLSSLNAVNRLGKRSSFLEAEWGNSLSIPNQPSSIFDSDNSFPKSLNYELPPPSRSRAETFSHPIRPNFHIESSSASKPILSRRYSNALPPSGVSSESTRVRAGSFAHSSALTDAFGPSLFSPSVEHEGLPELSFNGKTTNGDGVSPLGKLLNHGISDNYEDTVVMAIDYLGLDDSRGDLFGSKIDPFSTAFQSPFNSSAAPRNFDTYSRLRSVSSVTESQVGNSNLRTLNRPRSFSIPSSSFIGNEISTMDAPAPDYAYYDQQSPAYSDDAFVPDNSYPSKSLWVGNLDSSVTPQELITSFSFFGAIESFRILHERECAFINYSHIDEAVSAKENMNGAQVGNCIINVGYGRFEYMNESHGNQPTKSLWVGNLPSSVESFDLESYFSAFGQVESVRILSHKNCAFVNFIRLEDAIEARRNMHGREFLGLSIKIGFAKVPAIKDHTSFFPQYSASFVPQKFHETNNFIGLQNHQPIGGDASSNASPVDINNLEDIVYMKAIPPLPEPLLKIDSNRMKEYRKKIESPILTESQFVEIFNVIIQDPVTASADYIGNVVVQKIMERGNDEQRLMLIKGIGMYMASVGIHKNGTWAIQKILALAQTPAQIHAIIEYLKPMVPVLLLDQFGNYVVQCCLRFDNNRNNFVFEAIMKNLIEVGTGRFGSRSIRTCLESQYTTKRQQKTVANLIVQHGAILATDPNGSLLIGWLLDVSALPGRYRSLAPVFLSHIVYLSTHKLASITILKLLSQRIELETRDLILNEIFFKSDKILYEILCDVNTGLPLVKKIITSSCINLEERSKLTERVHKLNAVMPDLKNVTGFKKLLEEIGSSNVEIESEEDKEEEIISPLTPRPLTSFNAVKTPTASNGGPVYLPTPSKTPHLKKAKSQKKM